MERDHSEKDASEVKLSELQMVGVGAGGRGMRKRKAIAKF